jgi:hypothetical protein
MIFAWLIVLACYSILSAAELNNAPAIPLPVDAVQVMEKVLNIGPSSAFLVTYETALSVDRLNSLYKKEMAKGGWVAKTNNLYMKDNYLAIIVVIPPRNSNSKTKLTITTSSIPSKEEILAARKTTPDKLDFMPIYPGSVQAFLWDIPTGVSGSYETEDSINDVVFFYKSGMLNYGWQLYSETPMTTKDLNNCPGCKKSIPGELSKAQSNTVNTSSQTSLMFRRGDGETCVIRMYNILIDDNLLAKGRQVANSKGTSLSLPGKTNILVTYNAKRKINP